MVKERYDSDTTSLLDTHCHPLRAAMDMLRTIILDTDPSIEEGVKWNTASFRTSEWFATLNGPKQVKAATIILHTGAKAKGFDLKDRIPDPEGLLKWLGDDRAQIVFNNMKDIESKRVPLQRVLVAWIENYIPKEPH